MNWFGTIPRTWETRPLWTVMHPRKNKNSEGKEQNLLSLSYGRIIRKSIDTATGLLPESFNGYNIIEAGDIVLRLTDLQNDMRSLRTGLVKEHGIITSAYLTLIPKEGYLSAYYHYLLHAYDILKGFYNMGEGIRQGLGYDELSRLILPVPSFSEQTRIAAFLDERCGKIDEAIAKHKALIEKLDEYRKAVITQAVTKGVRGEREMKETEIPWLSSIPAEWEATRFKFIGRTSHGFSYKPVDVCGEDGCLVIRASNIQNDRFVFDDNVYVTEAPEHLRIKAGDIIICATNGSLALVGKSAVATKDMDCVFGSFMLRYRTRRNPAYIQYLLTAVIPMHRALFATTTINQITMVMFSNMMIPNPSTDEQSEIVAFLDKKCAAIDSAKQRHQQLITKLEEYKKSLIYNAVTGKIEC